MLFFAELCIVDITSLLTCNYLAIEIVQCTDILSEGNSPFVFFFFFFYLYIFSFHLHFTFLAVPPIEQIEKEIFRLLESDWF